MNEIVKQALNAARAIQQDIHIITAPETKLSNLAIKIDAPQHDKIYLALHEKSESLANSYAQVKIDIESDNRLSWAGTAHEIREILATLLRLLAPDTVVTAQSWYKREPNSSGVTQKQRVVYILKSRNSGSNESEVLEQITGIEEMVGSLVRSTYSRASDAAHRFKERQEVEKILRYFDAFAYDLLDL
jgi:hypothetical protein